MHDDALIPSKVAASTATLKPEDQIDALFAALQQKVDFDYFAVSNVSPLRNSHHHEAIKNCCTNFGDAWLGRYTDQKLFLDDPIVDFATLTTSATAWDQLCGLTAFEKRHRNVLGAAREEGIRAGVFMSTRQMNGDTQLISFARAEEREFSDAELHLATVYGQMIAKAMNGAVLECEAVRDLKVSARELECLSLSAIGKSSAEIEVILGISRHTVDFHIKNLMGKLDASTRTYAIVKAIRLGMINP